MKNLIYKLGLVCFMGVALVSCDEDRVVLNPNNGSNLWLFNSNASNLALSEDGVTFATDTVEVGITSVSDVDRVIPIHVDVVSSTASTDQYQIQASSLVVPAGEFVGKVVLTGNFEALPELTKLQIVLTFDDGVTYLDDKNFHVVTIFRVCPYTIEDFVGTYDALEDGSSSYEVEIVAGDEPFELLLSNVWDVDPDSETRIYLTDDLANPFVTYPPSYSSAVANPLYNYLYDNETYGAAYVNGDSSTSTFDSCEKTITLDFSVAVSAGTFSPTHLVLTKQ